jgi:terminase large subunit-like protein
VPKYTHIGNPEPLITLKYNPVQEGFLRSLLKRKCTNCRVMGGDGVARAFTFFVDFERKEFAQHCPKCGLKGKRVFTQLGIRAGRRFGKTRIGTLGTILEAQIPRTNHWICAPTYPLLDEFAIPTFFAQLPQDLIDRGHWKESDRHLYLPNGSEVKFVSLDNPERGRGSGLDTLCLDEAAQMVKKAWEVVSPALTDKEGAAWAITTPQGRDWTEEVFETPAREKELGYWYAEATSLEAPHLNLEYIEKRRRSMSPEMFAQEFMAQRVIFEGAIFGDMLMKRVIDDSTEDGMKMLQELIPEWPNIDPSRPGVKGLDPGADHPFGGISIVSTPRGLVVVDEYSERHRPAAVHKLGIFDMLGASDPRYAIDRSQLQMQIELAQEPRPLFATPAENDVVAGIERMKSWAIVGGIWIVKSKCPKFVAESTGYRWKDTKSAKDEGLGRQEPIKKNDDILDAARYALMLWPQLPEEFIPVPTKVAGRDLLKVDEQTRYEIERMRKCDPVTAPEDTEFAYGMHEFYQ